MAAQELMSQLLSTIAFQAILPRKRPLDCGTR